MIPKAVRLVTIVLLLFAAARMPAGAYDWNTNYGIDLSQGWDDNYRLSAADKIETGITTLGVFGDLTGSTEISSLRFELAARGKNYSSSRIENSVDKRLSFAGARQGERWRGGIDMSYASESTTETELLDTGNVIDGSRDTARISPNVSYRIDQRNSLTLSFDAKDVSYDTVSFTDYANSAASIAWSYNLNETNFVRTSWRGSVYDPANDDTTQVNALNIGYWWNADPVTSYGFTIGYAGIDRPSGSDADAEYSADVNRELDENNLLSATLAGGYIDSGSGQVRYENQLTVRWLHALSARARVDLSVDGRSNDFRDYIGIQFGSSYLYTREVRLGASLRHRRQDPKGAETAYSNGIFFNLTYSPI